MNKQLEQYLDEVRDGLAQTGMPTERRNEELMEMRQHLEASIEAGVREGAGEQEATQKALRHFGSATEVQRGLLQAWRRSQPWRDTTAGAFLIAFAAYWVTARLKAMLFSYDHVMGWITQVRSAFSVSEPIAMTIVGLVEVATVVLVGILIGAITRRWSGAPKVNWAIGITLCLPLALFIVPLFLNGQITSITWQGIHVKDFEQVSSLQDVIFSYFTFLPMILALLGGMAATRFTPPRRRNLPIPANR